MARGEGDWTVDYADQSEAVGRLVDDGKWVKVGGGTLPFPVYLRLGMANDGRLVCTDLLVGEETSEITSRSLRALPLGEVVESIVEGRDDPDFGSIVRGAMGDLAQIPRRRPGPGGYGRDHFERVADAYRTALATSPRAPMQTLARHLEVSEATARRWVQRARDQGLLGASQPGKAGEQRKGGEHGGDDA